MTATYEIKVRGRLSRTLAAEFAQLELSANTEPVSTILRGPVSDQAALYGLLRRLELLGLELVEVRKSLDDEASESAGSARSRLHSQDATGS